ncbi:MAG: fumarylacetoacetase [Flavobacteriales bacterium]|nr:fumarylacetoacetase [Flavobacteriales bacterium]
MIRANNPELSSWIDVPEDSDFPIQNIPFGIFSHSESSKRVGIAIGSYILDLAALGELGYFDLLKLEIGVFESDSLNAFMSTGQETWREVRDRISELLDSQNPALRDNVDQRGKVLIKMEDATMYLPVRIRDYTDFYSSIEHATNVGTMFRDPDNALLPNWKHLPVGYHGRASSIIVSGENINRPKGQTKAEDADSPSFGPSRLLDFELELGFFTGKRNPLGHSISTTDAEDHIFGMVLFNDWSARDVQKWEYVPLGPFLAKSFASSISPWVVTLDALDPFRVEGPNQDPEVLPYLQYQGAHNFDINLEVQIEPEGGEASTVCNSNFKFMYWNMAQQLAHQTVNGCNIDVGDMYASGTISGHTPDSFGSMLELAWKGTKPITLRDGSERKFILDGDTVIMKGNAEKNGVRVGFGEVRTKVLPSL